MVFLAVANLFQNLTIDDKESKENVEKNDVKDQESGTQSVVESSSDKVVQEEKKKV